MEEAKKCIVRTDEKTVEIVSQSDKGRIKLRNCKHPVLADPQRYQELLHIDKQISELQTVPDFGYGADNYLLERDASAPKNWNLMTEFVFKKDKYEWL